MKLEDFKWLTAVVYARGVKKGDPLARRLQPGEYFAYKMIRDIQGEIISRMECKAMLEDKDLINENIYDELEEIKEFIDILLAGKETTDDVTTPVEIMMTIEV